MPTIVQKVKRKNAALVTRRSGKVKLALEMHGMTSGERNLLLAHLIPHFPIYNVNFETLGCLGNIIVIRYGRIFHVTYEVVGECRPSPKAVVRVDKSTASTVLQPGRSDTVHGESPQLGIMTHQVVDDSMTNFFAYL